MVSRSIWRQAGTGGGEFVWLEAGIPLGSEQVEPSEDPVLPFCAPSWGGWDREGRICLCLSVPFLGWAGGSVQGSIFNGYGVCLTAQVLGRKVEISRISERDEINKVDLSLT